MNFNFAKQDNSYICKCGEEPYSLNETTDPQLAACYHLKCASNPQKLGKVIAAIEQLCSSAKQNYTIFIEHSNAFSQTKSATLE